MNDLDSARIYGTQRKSTREGSGVHISAYNSVHSHAPARRQVDEDSKGELQK